MISILDMRSNELVHQAQIHAGSINALCSNLSSFSIYFEKKKFLSYFT
jgi:hypothetical protein